jgi:hypothetical protein
MAAIQNPRLLYLKGALFLVLGALSGTALLLETPSPRHALFLALTVWGFARAYYFGSTTKRVGKKPRATALKPLPFKDVWLLLGAKNPA